MKYDLHELTEAGIITQEIAEKIEAYYARKNATPSSRLFIVFGILGAILVGLGTILIIAHNWDNLTRSTKTVFAFLPLLIGQCFCGYTLLQKKDSIAWRESSATFLFFGIGASISLISQIYNIPGNLSGFLLTWMLLGLPLIYLMPSSMTSLLYLIGITAYAGEMKYWSSPYVDATLYWGLLLLVLLHYVRLVWRQPQGNFTAFHHWFLSISVVITLGTVAEKNFELMFIAYFSLFGLLYLIGNIPPLDTQRLRSNGFKVVGSLGSVILLLALSFDEFWSEMRRIEWQQRELLTSPELLVVGVLTVAATALLFQQQRNRSITEIKPIAPVFLLFIVIFLIGTSSPIAVLLINGMVLGIGVLTMREGAERDHLGILNYGLLVITALVICRFFDADLSFVVRGLLFVAVGVGFFLTNYRMLKKRKSHE